MHNGSTATGARWSTWSEPAWARHFGTPTMTFAKLELLLADLRIVPAVNEMELHPLFEHTELFCSVEDRGLEPLPAAPIEVS